MKVFSHRSQRGSILLVAMVIGSLLSVALGSYVMLNTHSLKMANRSFYGSEAMNMAESGLEEAVWSFNQFVDGDTTAWDGWNTSGGTTATRTFTDFSLGANLTGAVKVYVSHFNPAPGVQPKVVARATVTLPNGQGAVTKTVEIMMKRRSLFATGLVARNNVNFSGNASVDSWISDPDNDPTTAAVPYSAGVKRDKGSVGAAALTAAIYVGNADIFGTASVGGPSDSSVSVGPNGIVGPFGTASGVKNPANIGTDFSANFDPVTAPTTGTVIGSIGATLGTTGTTTMWRTPDLDDSVTVYGDVTIILTAPQGTQAINLTGSDGITLAAGAKLTIYTSGDVKIAGNGLLNNNAQPESFQLWGTSTSSVAQDIQIAGNGSLKGIIYAPNGNIKMNGNGHMMGAAVGNEVTLTGNAAFHYDESLADWGVSTPFGIFKWRELVTPDERAAYATHLAF